jgi:hypothetical protein
MIHHRHRQMHRLLGITPTRTSMIVSSSVFFTSNESQMQTFLVLMMPNKQQQQQQQQAYKAQTITIHNQSSKQTQRTQVGCSSEGYEGSDDVTRPQR